MIETFGGTLGAALAVAVLLLVSRWVSPAPMDLAAAWRHLSHRTTTTPTGSWGLRGRLQALPDRIVTAAARCEHPWLRIPSADLALLEISARTYVVRRLRAAGLGAAAGLLLGLAPVLLGGELTGPLMPLGMLAGAGFGALWPVWRVREAAMAARHDARRALATHLELVAGERAGGAAPAPALVHAAQLGEHWLFTRLHQALSLAQRTGHTPWSALRALGGELQLDALVDLADIAETASDGAAVHDSLAAHAASLRHQSRTDERAAANSASERLTLPTSLLMISFLLLVLYPTAVHLLAS